MGEVEDIKSVFIPAIHLVTSLQTPTSITVAAFTGARWRTIQIPEHVVQRSFMAQRGWVTWRIKTLYKINDGKCPLFGDILGYLWRHAPDAATRFDARGNIVCDDGTPVGSGVGSMTIRKKNLPLNFDHSE